MWGGPLLKYFWEPSFPADGKKKAWNELINQVSRWRELVGATRNVSEDAIGHECRFLLQAFPEMRLTELGLCIDLYVKRALPTESYYNFTNFHPAFMAEVIRAYMKFRYERLKNIIARVESKMSEPDAPTAAERAETMRWMINEIQAQKDQGRQAFVFISDVYNFLERTGRIKATVNSEKEMKHYVQKRISQFNNMKAAGRVKSIGEIINTAGVKPGEAHKRSGIFRMEYWVFSWMGKGDLKTLLEKITVKDFLK